MKSDTRAKLQKRLTPAKGKLKLRDLMNDLGGVLFWDAATRTVTAYAPGLVVEMQIGSAVVRVNGRAMHTDLVPRLANGRTIVDAGLYDQVHAFAENGTASASIRTR